MSNLTKRDQAYLHVQTARQANQLAVRFAKAGNPAAYEQAKGMVRICMAAARKQLVRNIK